MAEPISFKPDPVRTTPNAEEELQMLLQSLHRHGFLRAANDFVCASGPIAKIVAGGLESEGARHAVRNLGALLIALGRVDPNAFYKVTAALTESARDLGSRPGREAVKAPGLTGAYHLLNDDDLWRSLTPAIDAIKAFAARLEKPVQKPVSDLSGKPSRS